MFRNAGMLEVKREDRAYELILPNNVPLGELHDVLFQMRSFVIDRINEAINADKPQEPKPVEEVSKQE